MTRFDLDINVRMEPSEHGRWVRYEDVPKRQPLTDEEIEDEWERTTGHSIFGGDRAEGRAMYISPNEVAEFARAIEAAHGIKGEA